MSGSEESPPDSTKRRKGRKTGKKMRRELKGEGIRGEKVLNERKEPI